MSEISTHTDVISIQEVNPVQEVHDLLEELNMFNKMKSSDLDFSSFVSIIPHDLLGAINAQTKGTDFKFSKTSTLKSPNLLYQSFRKGFSSQLKVFKSDGISPIIAKKASFLSALKKTDFKVSSPEIFKTNITAIIESKDMSTLNKEINTTIQRLEVEHAKVFTINIAKACANASHKVGFKDISVKKFKGKLEVIATNSLGQHLNSEISVDPKTKVVNTNTETIGITDNSCTKIMSQFNEELKKMGVKTGNENSWFTGGIPYMAFSKRIKNEEKYKVSKKNEHDRLVRLNNNTNQKQKI